MTRVGSQRHSKKKKIFKRIQTKTPNNCTHRTNAPEECKKLCKVKCSLVQTLRLCTGRTAYRESTGIVLLFHDQRHQKGVRGYRHAQAALYTREKPGTHCTGGWVCPRAILDRCGKSRTHRDSIPGPSSPQPVAIPTELPPEECNAAVFSTSLNQP